MSKFKVGDRVQVVGKNHNAISVIGTITECLKADDKPYSRIKTHIGPIYVWDYDLAFADDQPIRSGMSFTATEIGAFPFPLTETQTKTPKEEPMRYAVLYHDLAAGSQPQIQANKATEAEAKLLAEQLVAQRRSNLTVKQYFTVAIIDMQTGKLVGSVSDAPPAVDWQV